jgi:prepilin-type processing-associated H-X9-DG protein
MGLGLHNYVSTHNTLPPGDQRVFSPAANKLISNGDFSLHVRLLSYMEQQSLYNAANFSVPILNDTYGVFANSTIMLTKLNAFLCPSAPPPIYLGTGLAAGPATTAPVTGNCYFGSMGSSLEYDTTNTGGPPNGLFYFSGTNNTPPVSFAGVTDGLSNTIAIGEWKPGMGNAGVVSIPQDVIFAGLGGLTQNSPDMIMSAVTQPKLMMWLATCTAGASPATAGTRGPRTTTLGQYWAVGLPILTLGNVILGPNPKYPNCGFLNSYNSGGMYTLSSYHSGGCNVVMGDGSVRFIKDSISLPTIWALGSRNQGEVISSDSY